VLVHLFEFSKVAIYEVSETSETSEVESNVAPWASLENSRVLEIQVRFCSFGLGIAVRGLVTSLVASRDLRV
jgi:hypothetical protein